MDLPINDTQETLFPVEAGGPASTVAYEPFLRDLKERIHAAQIKGALAVNHELVLLYWQIGTSISRRMREQGWGAKFVDQLAADLSREFPHIWMYFNNFRTLFDSE